ncbi:MAG: hypothetical protein LBF97_04370, partial [Elusimicrobiota bacterium]|nr:hypothetical protein [Elusimicrobiota bacterium]
MKGKKSHNIIKKGLEILISMTHRGAVGADPLTGDGAGILIQMPDEFFRLEAKKLNINLPELGKYAAGMIFLPQSEKEKKFCIKTIETEIKNAGQKILFWRDIPVNVNVIGKTAQNTKPIIKQIFIEMPNNVKVGLDFERRL